MLMRTLAPARPRRAAFWLLCAALTLVASSKAFASGINYGDFGPDFPPGITMYQGVTESSGTDAVPLYGPPSISGDTLDFDPKGFVASATNGAIDITDGQLNLTIMMLEQDEAVAGGFTALVVSESGDFSLFGAGTSATSIGAGIYLSARVLEVDGNPLATPLSVIGSTQFSADLASSPGLVQPWANVLFIDFGPALANAALEYEFGVTKAEIVIDDELVALSEEGTLALIAKKDFRLDPVIVPNPRFPVPEPSSAALLLVALAALTRRRRGGAPA